jgi:hypothetical protein
MERNHIMSNGLDLTAVKLEFVRDVTIAYLENVYPKPLTALSEDARRKAIEQHREEINEFIKSIYATLNKFRIPTSGK